MTIEQRAARNGRIRADLATGLPVHVVATKENLSDRQVRYIWDERTDLPFDDATQDPRRVVQDQIDAYGALIGELAERGQQTKQDSVWISTVKARFDLFKETFELKRMYGLAPRAYDEAEQQSRMIELLELIAATLARHQVGQEALSEVLQIVEGHDQAARRELRPPLLRRLEGGKEPS